MATRDILVLNTTASRAETQQSSDTVMIKGGGEILSIENSSASPILTVQSSGSQTTLAGKITSTGNLSGVITGSFGKVEGTTLIGSAFELTDTDLPNTLSSSAQIASQITGSFRRGFEFTGTISGSGGNSTGSFGHIHSTTLVGDANNLTNTQLDDTISGSAQIAADISGSFNKGFEFTGTISGSSTTLGSFGKVVATTLVGSAENLTNTDKTGTISSSAQLAADISGSFNKGFNYTGRLGSTLDAWSAGNAFNIGTLGATSAGSSKDSALKFGGRFAPNNAFSTCTEEWNGTNWSEVNNMNDNRHEAMGGGSTESALSTGGCNGSGIASPALTEYWNGTNWTEKADLITPRKNGASAGTSADIIVAGGAAPSATTHVELYSLSGNAWSETTETPTALSNLDAVGTQNSTFIACDAPGSSLEWNGSAWSTAAGSIIDRSYFGLAGTVNDAVQVGATNNTPTLRTCTEKWNGYSWSVGVDAIYSQGAQKVFQGTGRSAVQFGSSQNDGTSCTQTQMYEASDDFIHVNTLTAQTLFGDGSELTNTTPDNIISSSAQLAADISGSFNKGFEFTGTIQSNPDGWSLGPNMIFASSQGTSTGTTRDGVLVWGGRFGNTPAGSFNNGSPTCVEEYNGSTWASITGHPGGQWLYNNTAAGSSEAALGFGNHEADGGKTMYYNGSSWADKADLITGRKQAVGIGQSADGALAVGGAPGAYTDMEQYDLSGNAWSESTAVPQNIQAQGATGTSEAAIIVRKSPGSIGSLCYDGEAWSEFAAIITDASNGGAFGTQNDAIHHGGSGNAYNNRCCTEHWNGTSWSAVNPTIVGVAGYNRTQGNTGNAGLAAGTQYGLTTPTYNRGFNTTDLTQLWDGGYVTSASFGRVDGIEFVGSGSNITNLPLTTDSVSGSAQLAADISGSFNKGFEFTGTISGSSASTGSFGRIVATTFAGDGSVLTNTQLDGTISSSAQLADRISGSFNKGFEFTGTISGSSTTTGSFGIIVADKLTGDGSLLTGIGDVTGRVSGSAQLASQISGSFTSGFEFTGEIRTAKGVWSTGGNMNAARRCHAGSGTQNAALATGGQTANAPSNAYVKNTEEYNGSSWTAGNNMITYGRQRAQVGTQNASLLFGGYNTCDDTEEYNGTNFATGGNLAVGRYAMNGFGTQNAAFGASGTVSNRNGKSNASEQYDGAVWSNSVSMIVPRFLGGGVGTQNAGIVGYGQCSNDNTEAGRARNCTELWDGTSWSETVGAIITGEQGVQSGTQNTFAVTAGCDGAIPSSTSRTTTQFFDGTAYSMDGDLITAAFDRCGANKASQDAGLVFGGGNPTNIASTEEYNAYYTTGSFGRVEADDVQIVQDSQLVVSSSLQLPVFASNSGIVSSSAGQMWFNSTTRKLNFTMDVNSWSAGGNMILGRAYSGAAGIQNAALAVGGSVSTSEAETELYNGSTWSESGDLNTARWGLAATGTQNSALAFGGYTPSPAVTHHETEQWNGSNWTEVIDLIVGRLLHAGIGTQNAALAVAGYEHSPAAELNDTEEWNGTSWYTAADNNTARRKVTGAGTQNAGIIFGGSVHPAMSKLTETYDGTTWTERNDLNTARGVLAGAGTQNAAVAFGGAEPSVSNKTEEWNGTSWSVGNAMGTARTNLGGVGSQSSGLAFGGSTPSVSNATEEYSVSSLKTVEIDGV